MTGEQWRAIKTIAAEALDVPDSERAAFVEARCAADPALRAEVASILRSAREATTLYETPVMSARGLHAIIEEAESAAGTFVGRRIGAYRLLGELGRGGMGAAYLAERADRAFTRLVALKLIKRGMDTDAILRRFIHERQILANLNHPNIATLLDGGTTDDDLPYFVMEYVDGQPIDVFCDERGLSIRERLALFVAVCGAVEHAHQNRIIHRDLKPANILVTKAGVPKLLDFGIAKLLDPEGGLHTEAIGQARAMTPEYASPEQIRGEPVNAAADVYSLGVLLYQLLTGHNPQAAAGRTPLDTARAVSEDPPRPPSALRRHLPRDLDTIVLTALQREPQRRYADVGALADDIGRFLDGQPILARAAGRGTRLLRQLRQPRTLAAAAATLALIALAAVWYGAASRRAAVLPPPLNSIAVLPIATPGEQGEAIESLAEGITENVIRRLSRVSQLKVIARDSVYRYAGQQVDAVRAGRELGVRAVLKGQLTASGGAFVLNAELVDARDGSLLWDERYQRPTADVQFLQAELAQQIANRLRVHVSSDEQARVAHSDTPNPQAYQLYLRGRYFWNKRTRHDFRKAVSYFTQAVERDPAFALAYTGLADSYSLLTEYHVLPARETYRPAKDAATRALAIDDTLAEAHASLAYIKQFYEWDFAGAEAQFVRALELDPAYATAHQWYAEFLSISGRHDEALAEIRRALAADPLSLIVNSVEANLLHLARRFDEAIGAATRVIEMDPNFPEVYEYLKRAYDQKGQYALSVQARQARRRLIGLNAELTPALRAAAAATGRRAYWQKRLEQELLEAKTEGVLSYEMAELAAQTGDVRGGLDWLERACQDSDFMIMTIRVAPNLDPLRAHPRFQAMLGRSCRVPSAG